MYVIATLGYRSTPGRGGVVDKVGTSVETTWQECVQFLHPLVLCFESGSYM